VVSASAENGAIAGLWMTRKPRLGVLPKTTEATRSPERASGPASATGFSKETEPFALTYSPL
jgi:hypothetical protein